MELKGKRLVLGVTGGIAAYKAAELVRLLVREGAEVQVAMSEGATHFVTPTTFQALSGRPVYLDQWDARMPNAMAHIDLSRQADLLLVAPASADFLARIRAGMADDLLATMVLARDCPLLVAPAMNRQMWENPATRRNVGWLRQDGIAALGPDAGSQACGEVGDGAGQRRPGVWRGGPGADAGTSGTACRRDGFLRAENTGWATGIADGRPHL